MEQDQRSSTSLIGLAFVSVVAIGLVAKVAMSYNAQSSLLASKRDEENAFKSIIKKNSRADGVGASASSNGTDKSLPSDSSSEREGVRGSSGSGKVNKNNNEKEKERRLTKEEILEIMIEVKDQMEIIIKNVSHYEQELKNQLKEKKHKVSDEIFKDYILQEFKKAIKVSNEEVFRLFNTTEEAVKEASSRFADDPDYKDVINQLTLKLAMFGGAASSSASQ